MTCCDTCPCSPTCEEVEDFEHHALGVRCQDPYCDRCDGYTEPDEDRCRWCHGYSGGGDFCSDDCFNAWEDFWGVGD